VRRENRPTREASGGSGDDPRTCASRHVVALGD